MLGVAVLFVQVWHDHGPYTPKVGGALAIIIALVLQIAGSRGSEIPQRHQRLMFCSNISCYNWKKKIHNSFCLEGLYIITPEIRLLYPVLCMCGTGLIKARGLIKGTGLIMSK